MNCQLASPSSKSQGNLNYSMDKLKIRIKFADHEFEAEGRRDVVCRQFDKFQDLLAQLAVKHASANLDDVKYRVERGAQQASYPPASRVDTQSDAGTALGQIVDCNQNPPFIWCKFLPTGKGRVADTALMLLLAFRQLRNQNQVPVLLLNQSLKQSGCSPTRLDRMLAEHMRNKLVLKSGKGKGGKYQLTTEGIVRARNTVLELAKLLP